MLAALLSAAGIALWSTITAELWLRLAKRTRAPLSRTLLLLAFLGVSLFLPIAASFRILEWVGLRTDPSGRRWIGLVWLTYGGVLFGFVAARMRLLIEISSSGSPE